jgi:hypothetical protein
MSSKYLWEDSLEIPTDALPWTPGMLGRIQKDRGLQIEQYLPFLYANVSTDTLGSHYAPWVSRLHKMPHGLQCLLTPIQRTGRELVRRLI